MDLKTADEVSKSDARKRGLMDWRRHYEPQAGFTPVIGPAAGGLKYISLGMLGLPKGQAFSRPADDSEVSLIVLSGVCDVAAADAEFVNVGGRRGFFDGKAAAVYLPRGASAGIRAVTDVEIAVCSVPVPESSGRPVLVEPGKVKTITLGEGILKRDASLLIHDDVPAQRTIVGETIHSSGGWAGYPPNKHDIDNMPIESANEEVYLIQCDPIQGFGLLAIYDKDRLDEAYRVRNNDVVAIPRGYHPMVAGPGYRFGFLWLMAGASRPWKPANDPDHAWAS